MNGLKLNKQKTNSIKGFTIIEVVLVLAIAGLIFLMVFIALPALQRSQRDTQRKNDGGRLLSQVNSYQSNTRGNVPNAGQPNDKDKFIATYLEAGGDKFEDPSGDPYTMIWNKSGAADPTAYGSIYYNTSATCSSSNGASIVSAQSRKVAVRVPLEGGGIYCSNN